MNPKRWSLVAVAFFLPVASQGQESAQQPQPTVIRAARMFDGRRDTLTQNAVIVVEGGKIKAVGSGLVIPANAKVIDLGDLTLLPGLIDAHTHLLWEADESTVKSEGDVILQTVATQSTAERALLGAKNAKEDLEAGITTVR